MKCVIIIPHKTYVDPTIYKVLEWEPTSTPFYNFLEEVKRINRNVNAQLTRQEKPTRIFSRILNRETGNTMYLNPTAVFANRECPQSQRNYNRMYLR